MASVWTRAVWLEDGKEEEGVIPSVWVQGDKIRWPNGLNLKRVFKKQEEPSNTWFSFPLVKVKCTSGVTNIVGF